MQTSKTQKKPVEQPSMPLLDLLLAQEPKVRHEAPVTSKKAVQNLKYDSFRALILFELSKFSDGLTTVEIGDLMGYPRDYISPHIKALQMLGMLTRDGSTRKNLKTARKTECEICKVSDKYLTSYLFKQTGLNYATLQARETKAKLDRLSAVIASARLDFTKALKIIEPFTNYVNFNKWCSKKQNSEFCYALNLSAVCNQCKEKIK